MATLTELQTRLTKINARLESGAQSVTVDGTSTTLNVESLRKERARIEGQIAALSPASTSTRRRIQTVWLGGGV